MNSYYILNLIKLSLCIGFGEHDSLETIMYVCIYGICMYMRRLLIDVYSLPWYDYFFWFRQLILEIQKINRVLLLD